MENSIDYATVIYWQKVINSFKLTENAEQYAEQYNSTEKKTAALRLNDHVRLH